MSQFKMILRNSGVRSAEKTGGTEFHSVDGATGKRANKDARKEGLCAAKAMSGEGQKKEGAAVETYTDASVCRVLRIRRRILAEARKRSTMGVDWGVKEEEAGMTKAWILDYALEHGITPDFFTSGALEETSGKFTSVRLVGTTPNIQVVVVEIEATGKRELCRVRNIKEHPIHYKEVFTAIRVNLEADHHLEWIAKPNEVKY